VQRFRGGLVFKAHRLLYHPTLGLRVMKKKKKEFDLAKRKIKGVQGVKPITTESTAGGNKYARQGQILAWA